MDIENQKARIRPKEVETAVKLLIVSMVFSVASLGYDVLLRSENPWNTTLLVIETIIMLFWALLIHSLYIRKNWAQVVFSVVFIVGTLGMINPKSLTLFNDPVHGAFVLLNTAFQFFAMVLLFKPDSNQWYRNIKP